MTQDALRAVVVGAGLMGRHHADAIARAGGRLVAVVDPVLERAEALAGTGIATRSLRELDVGVDVVHICAPLERHGELAEAALGLGAHLVCEKPLLPDAESTTGLLEAARERGLSVVPVHQFLFQRGIRRLLDAPERLGTLVRCVFEAATAGTEHTSLEPDELVADILPHPLAFFTRIVDGELSDVDWLVLRPLPGELRALAELEGTTLEIVISTRGRPTRASLDLTGTSASAHADLFHGFSTIERGSGTGVRKLIRPFGVAGLTLGYAGGNLATRALTRELAYPGLRELVRRTYAAIATGSAPPIAERETIAVARARDAVLSAVAAAPAAATRR